MTHYMYPITFEKDGKQYYAHSEHQRVFTALGLRSKKQRRAFSKQFAFIFFTAGKRDG
jgi:hypothetical protein